MEEIEKLHLLSEASIWEAGEEGCRSGYHPTRDDIILTRASLPNGKTTTLLKSLLTSACENNCFYCPMRAGRDFRRATYKPDEFARMVVNLTKAGLIQGVFLSSGMVKGGIHTQDQLIDTAHILRFKLGYRGYLHLKIMPGAQYEQILASMYLADRVSINLEAPNAEHLKNLAPQKDFLNQLFSPIKTISEIRQSPPTPRNWKSRWPTSCTQFVLGGAGETDQELLQTTQSLHRQYQLSRAYFSAFTPQPNTPMADHMPVSFRRENRLYQADYLIRDYGFNQEELVYDQHGFLPENQDPKWAWANQHLRDKPVELNQASPLELMRVPGIGPKSAQMITQVRVFHRIHDLSSLTKIGVRVKRAQEFILLDGRQPASQLLLF